jgi:hypothetical protein
MPAGPAGSHLTGLSGTRPILVSLPDPADGGPAVVNGAGIVKDFSLHRVELEGLPAGFELRFVQWAPRGGGFAFVGRAAERPSDDYELWHADWAHTGKRSCSCRRLMEGWRFNSAVGPPFRWSACGQLLLVKTVPEQLERPLGPSATVDEEALLQHYATASTALLDLATGCHTMVGPVEGRALSYYPWIGMDPADVAQSEPGFAVTEPATEEGERYVIVSSLASDVEVWRTVPTMGVAAVATIADAVVEALLPGHRLLLKRRNRSNDSNGGGGGGCGGGNDGPPPSSYFIRPLGAAGTTSSAEVDFEPSRL